MKARSTSIQYPTVYRSPSTGRVRLRPSLWYNIINISLERHQRSWEVKYVPTEARYMRQGKATTERLEE